MHPLYPQYYVPSYSYGIYPFYQMPYIQPSPVPMYFPTEGPIPENNPEFSPEFKPEVKREENSIEVENGELSK